MGSYTQMKQAVALTLTVAVIGVYCGSQIRVAHEEYFPFYLAATKSRHNRESGQMLRTTLLASIPPSCEAVQLNILSRHGSRFPSSSTHTELQSLLEKLKQSAPQANLTKYLTGFLTELKAQEGSSALNIQGQQDMKFLASVYCDIWPKLCSGDPEKLLFQTTYKDRTIETAFWYAYQLLNLAEDPNFQSVSLEKEARFDQVKPLVEKLMLKYTFTINSQDDDLLRFFDACDRYVASVDENDTALFEAEKFVQSSIYLDRLSQFNHSMCSLHKACSLDQEHLQYIHSLCIHAVMMHDDYTACKGIGLPYMEVAEYFLDLENYYEKHRGYDINHRPACKLINTIATDIEKITRRRCDGSECSPISKGDEIPAGLRHILRVGHAETLMPVLASFNIVPTKRLTADGYSPFRPFHSGQLTPMAANLAFVTYQCPNKQYPFDGIASSGHVSGSRDPSDVDYKVLVLLNEAIVRLPNLLGQYELGHPLLPLDTFLNYMQNLGCDTRQFSELCKLQ